MDAEGMDTVRAAHGQASATVLLPCCGSLLSRTESVVPVEAHTAARPVAMDSVRGREGLPEEELGSCEVGSASEKLAKRSAMALPQGRHLLC